MEQKKDQSHLPQVSASVTEAKCVPKCPSCQRDLCIYPQVLPRKITQECLNSAWRNPHVDINTFMHGGVWVMRQAGRVMGNDTLVQRSCTVLVWFSLLNNTKTTNILPLSNAIWQRTDWWVWPAFKHWKVLCFFFSFLAADLTWSPLYWLPHLIYSSLNEFQCKHSVKQSRRGPCEEQNILFVFLIRSHLLWSTCLTRCFSTSACWRTFVLSRPLLLSFNTSTKWRRWNTSVFFTVRCNKNTSCLPK